MSYTSQPTNDRSMNGIITFDDGAGSVIEDGQINSNGALIGGTTSVNKLDVTYNMTLDGTLNVNSTPITPLWLSYLYELDSNIQDQIDGVISSLSSFLSSNNTWSGLNVYNNITTFNAGVVGLTSSEVGLGNCDNTSDLNKPISTATQTALNAKQNTISTSNYLNANLVSGGYVSNYQYDQLQGVTGNIQLQLDLKQDTINQVYPLSASYVGDPSWTLTSPITDTEYHYLSGVTSSIQNQLNSIVSSMGSYASLTAVNTFTNTNNFGLITSAECQFNRVQLFRIQQHIYDVASTTTFVWGNLQSTIVLKGNYAIELPNAGSAVSDYEGTILTLFNPGGYSSNITVNPSAVLFKTILISSGHVTTWTFNSRAKQMIMLDGIWSVIDY